MTTAIFMWLGIGLFILLCVVAYRTGKKATEPRPARLLIPPVTPAASEQAPVVPPAPTLDELIERRVRLYHERLAALDSLPLEDADRIGIRNEQEDLLQDDIRRILSRATT